MTRDYLDAQSACCPDCGCALASFDERHAPDCQFQRRFMEGMANRRSDIVDRGAANFLQGCLGLNASLGQPAVRPPRPTDTLMGEVRLVIVQSLLELALWIVPAGGHQTALALLISQYRAIDLPKKPNGT
jgi:hypothetical protein